MSQITSLFVTRLYRASLSELGPRIDTDELAASCYSIAEDDEAGQEWCDENGYPGYTSYASLTDLPWPPTSTTSLAMGIGSVIIRSD